MRMLLETPPTTLLIKRQSRLTIKWGTGDAAMGDGVVVNCVPICHRARTEGTRRHHVEIKYRLEPR